MVRYGGLINITNEHRCVLMDLSKILDTIVSQDQSHTHFPFMEAHIIWKERLIGRTPPRYIELWSPHLPFTKGSGLAANNKGVRALNGILIPASYCNHPVRNKIILRPGGGSLWLTGETTVPRKLGSLQESRAGRSLMPGAEEPVSQEEMSYSPDNLSDYPARGTGTKTMRDHWGARTTP